MKRATPFFAIAAVAVSLWGTLLLSRQSDPLETIMQRKLEYAQNLFHALILEDFDAMDRNSERLQRLSEASNWNVTRTHEYTRYSSEFRRAVDALKKAAQERDLDLATLAYTEMTLKCVQCHKYVRGVDRAALR
jgi:cytochrome c556